MGILARDGQTDGRTDGHVAITNTRASIMFIARVKTKGSRYESPCTDKIPFTVYSSVKINHCTIAGSSLEKLALH